MEQLSKQAIDAIRVELARYGLDVKAKRVKVATRCEVDDRIDSLRAMTFKTAGVKTGLMATLRRVKAMGYANDRYPSLVNPYLDAARAAYTESHRLLYRQRLLPAPKGGNHA